MPTSIFCLLPATGCQSSNGLSVLPHTAERSEIHKIHVIWVSVSYSLLEFLETICIGMRTLPPSDITGNNWRDQFHTKLLHVIRAWRELYVIKSWSEKSLDPSLIPGRWMILMKYLRLLHLQLIMLRFKCLFLCRSAPRCTIAWMCCEGEEAVYRQTAC